MPNTLPMPLLPAELFGEDEEGRMTVWEWFATHEPGTLALMFDPLKAPMDSDSKARAVAMRRGRGIGTRPLSPDVAKALGVSVVGRYDPDTLELTFA